MFRYLKCFTEKEWNDIVETTPILKELFLEMKFGNETFNDIDKGVAQTEFKTWLRIFNNKLGQVCMTYIFLSYFYNKGIPDQEWYRFSGKQGHSIQYYPHFEEEHFKLLLLFDYYVDIFYYNVFSAWDYIYHLVNAFYGFDFDPEREGLQFNEKVAGELRIKNKPLYDFLESVRKKESYKKARKLRIDFTHNFPPSDISSGISKTKTEAQNEISFGIGKYTPTKEFKENIDQILELLSQIIVELKLKLWS